MIDDDLPAGGSPVVDPSGRPISGHEDPPGEAPWAMQFVVRVEKLAPPTVDDVCVATAVATLRLLDEAEALGWGAEVERWLAGRIRKIVRRARGAAWARAELLPGVTVSFGTAEVRAFVPGPTDAVPPELAKLQVEGLVLPRRDDAEPPDDGQVIISMNPRWDLAAHPGKAAAQAAHAAQLVAVAMDRSRYLDWKTKGFPIRIEWPTPEEWEPLEAASPVVVTDAGFTVVEAGARTCVAN